MFIYTHKAEPCLPIGWASSFDAGPLCGALEVMAVAKEAGTKPAVNVMQGSLTLGGHDWEQTHILLLKTCKLPLCFGKIERTIRITFVSRWTTSEIKCIFLLLFYLRWKMQRKKTPTIPVHPLGGMGQDCRSPISFTSLASLSYSSISLSFSWFTARTLHILLAAVSACKTQ